MSLTKGSVFHKLCGLWLPMIVGVFSVNAIDLADAYFVGQLGSDSLAAIGYTFPVMLTLISLSLGLSSGASSILSRSIGSSSSKRIIQEIVSGAVAFAMTISLMIASEDANPKQGQIYFC
jgi:Na+-driven multidrug efflux pump